jgi:PAS domain S-box-containing protein
VNIETPQFESTGKLVAVGSGIAAILAFMPKARSALIKAFRPAWRLLTFPSRIADTVDRLSDSIDSLNQILHATNDLAHLSHSKAQLAWSASPIPMFECAPDGHCIWVNQALCDLFGLDMTQMLGEGWLSTLHPDDIPRVAAHWQDTLKSWVPYRVRYRVLRKGKEQINVEATASVIRNPKTGRTLSIWGRVDQLQEQPTKDQP